MSDIRVVLSSDNNYAPFIGTTIASICDNTESFINFYILDSGIEEKNRRKIETLNSRFKNFSIEFIQTDTKKYFKDFTVNGYLSLATYSRLLIPKIFPDFEKILYLDIDIIVQSDISKLYNKSLDGYTIGAVTDQGDKHYIKKIKQNMEMNLFSEYFNAGVLLINPKKWQEERAEEKILEIEEKYREKLSCSDQDVLNKYFENNYKILDGKYNSKLSKKDTVIRHFCTPLKPWQVSPELCLDDCFNFDMFWKYAEMTEFYDELIKNCKYKNKLLIQAIKARENQPFHKFDTIAPKVSVIVPVYNTEKFLRKCLNSLIYGALDDIEIICVNDGSTDSSLEILKEYKKYDTRIKIINFDKNKGPAVARNEGIKRAAGEFIGFVDSDDFVDLDFYQKLFNKALETNSDIIKGNLKYIEGGTLSNIFKDLNLKIKENKYNFNCNFSSAIYKTSLIKENNIIFPPDFNCGEDRYFQIDALLNSNGISVVDDTFYNYIKRENSLTTSTEDVFNKIKQRIHLLDMLLKKWNKFNLKNEDYTLLFNEFFIQITDSLRKRFNDTEKLYDDIMAIFSNLNTDKIPNHIQIVKNSTKDTLYNNLMTYEAKNLLYKIRLRGLDKRLQRQ